MANKVKEYRQKMGFSQQKLANIVGISITTLRNIENERNENTTIEIAIKLKRAFNIQDIEELFTIEK